MEDKPAQKNKGLQSKLRQYPFLVKLVFSIYLLICLPMIVIQMLTLQSSYRELSTQNDVYCFTETKNLSSQVMAQISAFQAVSFNMRTDTPYAIKEFFLPSTPIYMLLDVSKELSSYMISVPAARQLGLYYTDRELFINGSYYYRLDTFCASFAQGNEEIYEKTHSLFTHPPDGQIKIISSFTPESPTNAMLLFASPIKVGGYSAIAYFTMGYPTLNTFLTTSFSANSTFALFDKAGELLYVSSEANLEELQSAAFSDFLANEGKNRYEFASNGSVAYKWKEDGAAFTFVSIVAVSQFEENSATFFHTMQLSLLANIVLTVIMVAVTSYINYNPLRKLVSKISLRNPLTSSSELARIENAIVQLDNLASDQSMVIMEYVLNDLLYGTSIRQQQLGELLPNLDCQFFCAVSVVCSRPTTEQSRLISGRIHQQTGCHIFITDMPNREYILFVCLSESEIVSADLAASISGAVQAIMNEACRVYLGTVVKSLDDIALSYFASQAETGEQSGYIYASDYPAKEIKLFIRQAETRDFAAARESMALIFAYIDRIKHNRPQYRYICYEVMIAYISARQRTLYPMTESEQQDLLAFTNAEHLMRELDQSMAALEKRISQDSAKEDVVFQDEIVEFVNNRYNQTDISLITVADHFGISIYTLSRMFKSRTGIGFKEYITAKRLERACRLLITTKDNISIIAQNCGFESPTYFASIFKAHYGMTPSKFRGSSNQ